MVTQVRTRIAPSPTGEDLHIGNAYTALINYVFSKKQGGQFIIRIEDTDRTRFIEGSEQKILASLRWLGIQYDEGPDRGGPYAPYRQSERLAMYKKYAEELVEKGHAYYCFCTPERLARMRESQEKNHQPPMYDGRCRELKTLASPAGRQSSKLLPRRQAGKAQKERHTIRLKVPDDGVTAFTDLIRGEISFENKLIDDQVILKSDGYPTYHLGVVVDDHFMKISHVIRGEEWISSTPKHVLLYQFFGWKLPVYAHMPLLRNPDKSKLSKRKNPVWVSWYREQGYLPETLLNYLATLAWAHPEGKELFTMNEMSRVFDLQAIQTTAPILNTEKLRWMNGEYLRKTQNSKLKTQLYDFYSGKYDENTIEKTLPLVIERMKTLGEYGSLAGFFFERPKELERPIDQKLLAVAKKAIESLDWTQDVMERAIRDAAEKTNVKAKDVFMELRIAVTGKTIGPPLLESLEILGKDETFIRCSQSNVGPSRR